MTQTNICTVCGGEIIPGAEFCQFCGTPTQHAPAVVEEAQAVEEQNLSVCPNCGTPIKDGQKFCGTCGAITDPVAAVGSPMPGRVLNGTVPLMQNGPVSGAPMVAQPAQGYPVPAAQSDASAKFDAFMGSTIDLDSVGKDFDASMVIIEGVSDDEWKKAFSCFGKVYPQEITIQPATNEEILEILEKSRLESEQEEELQAQNKPKRDFSAQEGAAVFGALSSQLQTDFAPRVEMIASQREKAAKKEKVDRLKHKVALGDMDKQTAVELAED